MKAVRRGEELKLDKGREEEQLRSEERREAKLDF